MRILLIKRDKLGDLLLTRPIVTYLANALPHAQIHLLANDYNAWVARDHPGLERVWIYPRVRESGRLRPMAALAQIPLAIALRRARFDWAFVMGGDESHRAIRRAIATGARRVVAYAREPARYGARLTDPIEPPSVGHETARMQALFAPLRLPAAALTLPTLDIDPSARAFAAEWLAARGLATGRFVVIGLGARRAKKQPTAEQVRRWSQRLLDEWHVPTVLMWTPGNASRADYPGDDALAQQVLDRNLTHVHPFRGPLHEALGLIFAARTSIIPDSGLMHLAAASPGGVLGLFADPQDSAPAERWAPLGARARYLEADKSVAELEDDVVFSTLRPLVSASDVRRDTDSTRDRCTS